MQSASLLLRLRPLLALLAAWIGSRAVRRSAARIDAARDAQIAQRSAE